MDRASNCFIDSRHAGLFLQRWLPISRLHAQFPPQTQRAQATREGSTRQPEPPKPSVYGLEGLFRPTAAPNSRRYDNDDHQN